MINPITMIVLWVTVVLGASSLTLVSVACNSALTLLASVPSASLVELCDFGNQQVAIASNSTVVLRSTVLGGVLIVATAGGIIENVSLTLVNCSMVGLADPTYPFMGSYGYALVSNVAISLQDTVLRRNNVSLQSSSSEGGALFFARCAVTQLVIVVSGSQIQISQLASLSAAFQFFLTHYENVAFCFERSTIELTRWIAGDLSVMRIEGDSLNAVNVSVKLLTSSVTLLSRVLSAGVELRLYSFLFYYNLTSFTSVQLMADGSQVSIGSQVSDEFVPRWVSFLDAASGVHVSEDMQIQNCSFRFRGTDSVVLLSLGNSAFNSTVLVLNSSVVGVIYNVSDLGSPDRKFFVVSVSRSESNLIEIAHSSAEVKVVISGQGSSTACRVALVAFAEARMTLVNLESTQMSIYTPPQSEVFLNVLETQSLYVWMFLIDAEQGKFFSFFLHVQTVVSVRRCRISSALFVPQCQRSPAVQLVTGIAVISPASTALHIAVHDSTVIAMQSTFVGASSVLRFATVVAIAQTQLFSSTLNASVLLGNVTVDASQLDEFVTMSAVQLPPTVNTSVIAVSNVRLIRALASTVISILLCGDNCVVLGSTFAIINMSIHVSAALDTPSAAAEIFFMHAAKFFIDLGSPPSLLLSSCRVAVDNVAIESRGASRGTLLPSTVHQKDAMTWSLHTCTFTGYRRFFNSSPSTDVAVTLDGCDNMWNGRPLRRSDIGAASSAINVVQGDDPVGARNCERLAATMSVSQRELVMQRKVHSVVRTLASGASLVGSGAALIASVSTVVEPSVSLAASLESRGLHWQ